MKIGLAHPARPGQALKTGARVATLLNRYLESVPSATPTIEKQVLADSTQTMKTWVARLGNGSLRGSVIFSASFQHSYQDLPSNAA